VPRPSGPPLAHPGLH